MTEWPRNPLGTGGAQKWERLHMVRYMQQSHIPAVSNGHGLPDLIDCAASKAISAV